MKELYVIRHGPAGTAVEYGEKDEVRPLTGKGVEKMKGVARGLKDRGVVFDEMISSPLVRAYQTAEIIQKYCMPGDQYAVSDLLKPGASYDELIEHLNTLDADRVAIVGHEPFLSGLTAYCLTGDDLSFIKLKKGGIAVISIDGGIEPGECELLYLLQPSIFLP